MKSGILLFWLLFPMFTSIACAGDMRLTDFLKHHGQQLAQIQRETPRQTKIARMLSRRRLSITKDGDRYGLQPA